jgi:hypothetical protein
MRLTRQTTGELVTLRTDSPLGSGGEARIFEIAQDTRLVAKIYHDANETPARKLAVMRDNPPHDPMAGTGERTIAWVEDVLLAKNGTVRAVGFLMPRVSDRLPVFTFYNPSARREKCPLSNWFYLHRTARNLAAAVRAIHERGYVIGDVNESNILASETALVTLVDTDSFQVRDPETGTVYRCPVGRPDFTPPELQGRAFADQDRTPQHDLFGLATLIFLLLMEGAHPFAGVYTGAGEPPPYEARIAAGHFPHGTRSVPYRPAASAVPFSVLHPHLQALFMRCFEAGHDSPALRPTAAEWAEALLEAEQALVTCAANPQHRFGSHLPSCPWCERTRLLNGRDPFPSIQSVRSGTHLPPKAVKPSRVLHSGTSPSTARAGAGGSASSQSPTPNTPHPQQWAYSAGSGTIGHAPALTVNPQNVWAFVALLCGVLACFPVLRVLAVPAIAAGILGVRAARSGIGGRGVSWIGIVWSSLVLLSTFLFAVIPHSLPKKQTFDIGGAITSLAFSPDSQRIASGTRRATSMAGSRGALHLMDAQTGSDDTIETVRGDVTCVAFAPQNGLAAFGYKELLGTGKVAVINLRSGSRLWDATAHNSSIHAVTFSPDGKTLATAGTFDYVRTKQLFAQVTLWSTSNGRKLHTFEIDGEANAIAISPDGQWLALGSGGGNSTRTTERGRISVWNIGTKKQVWTRPAHGRDVLSLAFAPDGSLWSAGGSSAVERRDIQTGTVMQSFSTSDLWVGSIAVSPDGKHAAWGGSDAQIRIAYLEAGKLARDPESVPSSVRAIAFAPDGKTLAAGTSDGSITVWQWNTRSR